MNFIDIDESKRNDYNAVVTHPLQSFEWGEFRKKTGLRVIRRARYIGKKMIDGYTMTLHPVPLLKTTIGYIPKCTTPTSTMLEDVAKIGKAHKTTFVQIEPNVLAEEGKVEIEKLILEDHIKLTPSFHPLFTKYSFLLNLEPEEETLLANMHPKTRYNIRVAKRHGVKVVEDNSEAGFEQFMKLYMETTTRQKFYAHTRAYHKALWELLEKPNIKPTRNASQRDAGGSQMPNLLGYHLFHAKLEDFKQPNILTSWVLFTFNNVLYYPYGASSRENRDAMANNLIMWEAIRFGKKKKCHEFDMWGALGPTPDSKDPWYGFHRFKEGYGAKLTEFAGSYDLILNPTLYEISKIGDRVRWLLLNLKKRL